TGFELGGAATTTLSDVIPNIEPESIVHVKFAFKCRLTPGIYFLNAGVSGLLNAEMTPLHRILDAAMFRVQPEVEMAATCIVDFEIHPSSHVTSLKSNEEAGKV